jgi:hypothetical protein
LVNLETTFYAEPATVARSLDIIGYAVDVTHTYVNATDESDPVAVRVDVTYTATYRVDGGPWMTIPESLTIRGTDTDLPVKEAAAVLVTE